MYTLHLGVIFLRKIKLLLSNVRHPHYSEELQVHSAGFLCDTPIDLYNLE